MTRWTRTACAFALALALMPIAGATARIEAADHTVRAEDKLRVKIYQYPELSGDYTVTSTGTISIAPIGDVDVAGLSTREIANRISERFVRSGISDRPGATVEVLESRPIYIVGDVQKPGEYAYRPGLTVLQAVSLAGGWYRPQDPGLFRIEREVINIKGEMRNLVRKYYQLLARRARLKAELEETTEIAFPPELTRQAADDPTIAQLIQEERMFLDISIGGRKRQLESMEKTRSIYEREIESVSLQIQANKKQSDSVGRELDEVKALFERGLAPVSRRTGLERLQSQITISEHGMQTLILRARQNITQIEQRIFDLEGERRSRIGTEIQRTRIDLEEIAARLDTNRTLMVEAQYTVPLLVGGQEEVETRTVSIVRVEGDRTVTMRATDNLALYPGDVLKVQRSIPSPRFDRENAFLELPGRKHLVPTADRD